MASQLKVDTLTGVTTAGSIDVTGEGNSTTTNLQQGLSKCWCLFNGTGTSAGATITPRDSFNVDSVTDVNTGIYQVAYSNNTASTNTVTSGSNVGDPTTSNRTNAKIAAYGSVTTSAFSIAVTINDGNYLDFTHVGVTVNGDLA
jgi:hypothetical protein